MLNLRLCCNYFKLSYKNKMFNCKIHPPPPRISQMNNDRTASKGIQTTKKIKKFLSFIVSFFFRFFLQFPQHTHTICCSSQAKVYCN